MIFFFVIARLVHLILFSVLVIHFFHFTFSPIEWESIYIICNVIPQTNDILSRFHSGFYLVVFLQQNAMNNEMQLIVAFCIVFQIIKLVGLVFQFKMYIFSIENKNWTATENMCVTWIELLTIFLVYMFQCVKNFPMALKSLQIVCNENNVWCKIFAVKFIFLSRSLHF